MLTGRTSRPRSRTPRDTQRREGRSPAVLSRSSPATIHVVIIRPGGTTTPCYPRASCLLPLLFLSSPCPCSPFLGRHFSSHLLLFSTLSPFIVYIRGCCSSRLALHEEPRDSDLMSCFQNASQMFSISMAAVTSAMSSTSWRHVPWIELRRFVPMRTLYMLTL